jgi:acetyl esterase/lipase
LRANWNYHAERGKKGAIMATLNRRMLLKGGLFLGTAAALAPRFGAAAVAAAGTRTASALPGMPVDALAHVAPEFRPALEPMLAMAAEFEKNIGNVAALRAMGWKNPEKPAESPSFERRSIPGPKGAPDVPVYVINAQPRGSKQPMLLHIHGGGYIVGTAESQIPALQRTARELDCVVVTVDYRLAPETPFPGSLEDNYAALRWLHGAADELGGDARRIAVMGESAGGGHAAMLAIAARDRGEFPLLAQILIYPMLDDRTASSRLVPEHIGQFIWTRAFNRFGWTSLLGLPAGSRRVPAGAVPARVENLVGLPPAFIGVGSIDLFVEEDMQYAQRLVSAGVPTELLVIPGGYHGFDGIAAQAPQSKFFRAAWSDALQRAFAAGAASS